MGGFVIGESYCGCYRMLGTYSGGSTLTTDYTINKGTCGGCAIILCSNHGSTTLTYIRAGIYVLEFPHTDTSINTFHVGGDNEWSFAVSSNVLTVSGGGTNWPSYVTLGGNRS